MIVRQEQKADILFAIYRNTASKLEVVSEPEPKKLNINPEEFFLLMEQEHNSEFTESSLLENLIIAI